MLKTFYKSIIIASLSVPTIMIPLSFEIINSTDSLPTFSQLEAQANVEIPFDGRAFRPGGMDLRGGNSTRFIYQNDGNIVVYRGNQPLWATGSNTNTANVLRFQTDGNLVLYRNSEPVWASNTSGRGNFLRVQDDSNIVIYNAQHQPIWSTDTWGGRVTVLNAAQRWQTAHRPAQNPQRNQTPQSQTPQRGHELLATSGELRKLQTGAYNGQIVGINCQCVSMVKHVTGRANSTGDWRRGVSVMGNGGVNVGSAIAIFNSAGRYNNVHAAIFAGYGEERGVRGFYAWSTNWADGDFKNCNRPGVGLRRHFIPTNGRNPNNANAYHVINLP